MNRWTDLLTSFSLALLLHGLLVVAAVWFWAVRPSALRPVFQGGDASLAVTFVAMADEGQTPDDGRQATAKQEAKAKDGGVQFAQRSPSGEAGPAVKSTETAADESLTEDESGKQVETVAEPMPEEGDDQDRLAAEPMAPLVDQASANVLADGGQKTDARRRTTEDGHQTPDDGRLTPDTGRQTTDAGQQTTDSVAAAPRQGVSGAVRMKSAIRPYYPLGARLRGEEGVVAVRVWVNSSGRALRCEVARSSGYSALDEAAMDAARRARYVSAEPGVWRAEAETTLTFRFRLTE